MDEFRRLKSLNRQMLLDESPSRFESEEHYSLRESIDIPIKRYERKSADIRIKKYENNDNALPPNRATGTFRGIPEDKHRTSSVDQLRLQHHRGRPIDSRLNDTSSTGVHKPNHDSMKDSLSISRYLSSIYPAELGSSSNHDSMKDSVNISQYLSSIYPAELGSSSNHDSMKDSVNISQYLSSIYPAELGSSSVAEASHHQDVSSASQDFLKAMISRFSSLEPKYDDNQASRHNQDSMEEPLNISRYLSNIHPSKLGSQHLDVSHPFTVASRHYQDARSTDQDFLKEMISRFSFEGPKYDERQAPKDNHDLTNELLSLSQYLSSIHPSELGSPSVAKASHHLDVSHPSIVDSKHHLDARFAALNDLKEIIFRSSSVGPNNDDSQVSKHNHGPKMEPLNVSQYSSSIYPSELGSTSAGEASHNLDVSHPSPVTSRQTLNALTTADLDNLKDILSRFSTVQPKCDDSESSTHNHDSTKEPMNISQYLLSLDPSEIASLSVANKEHEKKEDDIVLKKITDVGDIYDRIQKDREKILNYKKEQQPKKIEVLTEIDTSEVASTEDIKPDWLCTEETDSLQASIQDVSNSDYLQSLSHKASYSTVDNSSGYIPVMMSNAPAWESVIAQTKFKVSGNYPSKMSQSQHSRPCNDPLLEANPYKIAEYSVKKSSRSPNRLSKRVRSKSRSPKRCRSKSPRRHRSKSPRKRRSRSPRKRRSRSPRRRRSRSPRKRRSRSPRRHRSRSPRGHRSRSSRVYRSRSPDTGIYGNSSPRRSRSKSPSDEKEMREHKLSVHSRISRGNTKRSSLTLVESLILLKSAILESDCKYRVEISQGTDIVDAFKTTFHVKEFLSQKFVIELWICSEGSKNVAYRLEEMIDYAQSSMFNPEVFVEVHAQEYSTDIHNMEVQELIKYLSSDVAITITPCIIEDVPLRSTQSDVHIPVKWRLGTRHMESENFTHNSQSESVFKRLGKRDATPD